MKPTNIGCRDSVTRWIKKHIILIVYSHGSANTENLANISLVDFDMIGLTGIIKSKQMNKNQKQNV